MTDRYGPAPGEGPARRYGPVGRVAVLSDVHANVPAPAAVLAEPDVAGADLVVFCGDSLADVIAGMLTAPQAPEEIIAEAELLEFSD